MCVTNVVLLQIRLIAISVTNYHTMLQRIFFVFVFCAVGIIGLGQEKAPKTMTPKERAKTERKKEKAALKEQEKLKKEYRKRQSKSTRKSMKKNAKRSKNNRNRKAEKVWFWERWF